jgi:hypothetical protein
MKNQIFQILLFAFLGLSWNLQAQCRVEQYTDKGMKKLQGEAGYTFLKSYPVSGGAKEFSYIFSQGTQYIITLANSEADNKGFFITLLDSNKKSVGTSLNNGKFYPTISFNCKATGIYYLKFSFDGTDDQCAAGVLGMKR